MMWTTPHRIPQRSKLREHISEYTCSKGKSKTLGYNHIISASAKSLIFIYNNNKKKDIAD